MTKCANCAKDMADDMAFCPYCGHKVDREGEEHFEVMQGEIVLGMIAPIRMDGTRGTMAVAVTEERLIVIHLHDGNLDEARQDLARRGLFLPGSNPMASISKYYDLSPDQMLEQSVNNFDIPLESIESVRMSFEDSNGGEYIFLMRTKTGERKMFAPFDNYFRDLIMKVLKGKVVW